MSEDLHAFVEKTTEATGGPKLYEYQRRVLEMLTSGSRATTIFRPRSTQKSWVLKQLAQFAQQQKETK